MTFANWMEGLLRALVETPTTAPSATAPPVALRVVVGDATGALADNGVGSGQLPVTQGDAGSPLQGWYTRAAPSTIIAAGLQAATASALPLPSVPAVEVLIQADPANTTNLLIGTASSQPIALSAGQAITASVANLGLFFIKASSGSPVANWLVRS